jgi:hypothetical protein
MRKRRKKGKEGLKGLCTKHCTERRPFGAGKKERRRRKKGKSILRDWGTIRSSKGRNLRQRKK